MITVAWFILGWLAGIATLAIASVICINCEGRSHDNEAFIKALIEKEGWMGAKEVLTFEYNGKYMRIWRKLYREYIEKGEEE